MLYFGIAAVVLFVCWSAIFSYHHSVRKIPDQELTVYCVFLVFGSIAWIFTLPVVILLAGAYGVGKLVAHLVTNYKAQANAKN